MPEQFTDAIALLKADHRKVEDLFANFEMARTNKKELADRICDELKIHTAIEEEIFYSALNGKIDEDTLAEAHVEHDGAKVLINDIVAGGLMTTTTTRRSRFCRKRSHITSRKKKCRQRDVRAGSGSRRLVALRDAMLVRKEALTALAEKKGLPPAKPRVVTA